MYLSVSPELREFLVHKRKLETVVSDMEVDEIYKHVYNHNENYPHDTIDVANLLTQSVIVRRESIASHKDLTEMEILRLKAEERKYQKSIEKIASLKSKSGSQKSEFKDASESVAFASQFILAFASAFLLGYYLGEYFFEFTKNEYKYILGGACSFATLILESVLFIIREEKKELITSNKPKFTGPAVFRSSPSSGETSIVSQEEIQETLRKRKLK